MNANLRVFLSRTTMGLATLADKVDIMLKGMGFDVEHQPDFTLSWRKIRHMLMDKLRKCDAVICLVGPAYGFAPKTPIPEFRDPDTGREAFSYTQLEYLIARKLHKPVFTLLVPADGATFPLDPFTQDDTERDLQRDFIRDIIKARRNEHPYYDERSFPTHDALLAKLREALKGLTAQPPSYPESIPFTSIGTVFTGRTDTLRQLRETLVAAGSERPAVQVLHGMGGVGKTRVTVEYAHTFQHDYTARLFVTGNSPGALDGALANLAGIFLLNLEEQDEKENDIRIAAVIRWLAQHPGWLLVIDNVDTPEARDHALHIVSQLPPGHVLITTRIHTWPGHFLRTPLDVLSDTDGRDLLLAYRSSPKAEAEDTDQADALALAHDLDGLALALEQAAAYLNHIAITIAEYHQRWKANAERVKAWTVHEKLKHPDQADTEENKLRVSVATTWLTSFEQLTPAAQSLLNLLAWLAPDPIPRFLLKPLAEKKLQPDPLNGTDPYLALGNLTDFSLAKPDRKGVAFSVHRLVQEIAKERQDSKTLAPTQRVLPSMLDESIVLVGLKMPRQADDVLTWDIAVPLLPHAIVVASHDGESARDDLCGALLSGAALLLKTKAIYKQAEALYRRSIDKLISAHGTDHANVATAFNNLGSLLQVLERFPEAEELYRKAVAIDEKFCDNEALVTKATHLNNLADIIQQTGRVIEAEPVMREVIAVAQKALPERHPLLAKYMSNYGGLLNDIGRKREAEKLVSDAVSIIEEKLGPMHPALSPKLGILADIFSRTGRFTEAETLLRRSLSIDKIAYGERHPLVAVDLNAVAKLLLDTNRPQEAEPLIREAMEIDIETFGPNHHKVAARLSNLIRVLLSEKRFGDAEPYARRALEIEVTSYGKNHPNVALAMNNLAVLLHHMDRTDEVEELSRGALAINEATFGRENPKLATHLNNLATILEDFGKVGEAEPFMRRALELLLQSFRSHGQQPTELPQIANRYLTQLMKLGNTQDQAMTRLRAVMKPYGFSF